MATITSTETDENQNIIINIEANGTDTITLATKDTYLDKNIIFNIKTPQDSNNNADTIDGYHFNVSTEIPSSNTVTENTITFVI